MRFFFLNKEIFWALALQRLHHGLRTHEGQISNSLRPKFKFQSQINILKIYNPLLKFSVIKPILMVSLKLIICVNPRILDNQWIDTCLHTCHAHIIFIIRSVWYIDAFLSCFFFIFFTRNHMILVMCSSSKCKYFLYQIIITKS